MRNCPIFKQYFIIRLLHHFHHIRFIFGAVCGQFLTRTCFSRPRRTHFRSGGSRFYSTAVAVCSNYWCWLLTTSNCASILSILPNCATSHSTFLFSILYFRRRLRPLSLQFSVGVLRKSLWVHVWLFHVSDTVCLCLFCFFVFFENLNFQMRLNICSAMWVYWVGQYLAGQLRLVLENGEWRLTKEYGISFHSPSFS